MLKFNSGLLYLVITLLFSAAGASTKAADFDDLKSKLRFTGLVKLDVIYDTAASAGDRINYTAIPITHDQAKNEVRLHARETRLGISFQDHFNGHELKAYAEGDFFGGGSNSPSGSERIANATGFALRHAYIVYQGWLFGQTWSNFVDVKSFPETLDLSNATGQAFIRQGIVRYQYLSDSWMLSVAVENPDTDLLITEPVNESQHSVETSEPFFDITARASYRGPWGHVSGQTVLRTIDVSMGEVSHQQFAYGLGISGKLKLTSSDILRFHVSQGEGIGRYLQEASGATGIVFLSLAEPRYGHLKLLNTYGGYISYQRQLTPAIRANLSAGLLNIGLTEFRSLPSTDGYLRRLLSLHSNVIYEVFPRFEIGIEYALVNKRSLSGGTGQVRRWQFSALYRF